MVPNPFKNLPFNRAALYVMGVDKSGTEIYMPVENKGEQYIQSKKAELQRYLDAQTMTAPTAPAPGPLLA